jgi:hypothetical protein
VFASRFTLNNTIIANNGADKCFSNTFPKQGVSPAFNKADPGTSLPFDQRHVPRPQSGGFDIGAFERRASDK